MQFWLNLENISPKRLSLRFIWNPNIGNNAIFIFAASDDSYFRTIRFDM